MAQTTEVQETKKDEQMEDVLTESMLLHEGFEINSVETSIQQGVKPEAVAEDLHKPSDEKQYRLFDGEINVSDLEKSATGATPNDGYVDFNIQKNLIKNKHLYGSDSHEPVYAIDYDTKSAVKCEVGYQLRVRFENPMGREWTLVSFFEDEDEAIEAATEVETASTTGGLELIYEDGDYLLEKDGTLLEVARRSPNYAFGENRDIFGTMMLAAILSGLLANITNVSYIFVYITVVFGLPLILGSIDILNRYKDDEWSVYSGEYEKQESQTTQNFVPTENAGMEPKQTVVVDVNMLDDKVRIESDKLDTYWNFDINNGVMEEDGVKFFKNRGFDVSDGEQIEVTATRKELIGEDKNCILCENSNWYLYPTKYNN